MPGFPGEVLLEGIPRDLQNRRSKMAPGGDTAVVHFTSSRHAEECRAQGKRRTCVPRKFNETIHQLAITIATAEKTRTWRQMFQLPDIGAVQWTTYLSKAAQDRQEEMRANAKPRAKPSAKTAATNFTAAEEETFTRLLPRLKTREQKRLLHNRQHLANKWHCFKPFDQPDAM